MKKVLSLILAMAMVLSFVPQIFAADTEAAAVPDITFLPEQAGSEYSMKVVATRGLEKNEANDQRIRIDFATGTILVARTLFAIQISVPVSGKYEFSINSVAVGATRGGYANVYMVRVGEDTANIDDAYCAKFVNNNNLIGVYESIVGNGLQNVEYTFEKGDYLLVFTPNDQNQSLKNYKTYGVRCGISSMTLTKIEEEGNVEEDITDTTVSFKASAYEGGAVSNSNIQEVTIGSDVTVTATPDSEHTFAYWKNSAGVVLSTNATETFKVSTNLGVIAVFDAEATDTAIPVQFYNGNGLPLGNTSVAKDTTFGEAKRAAGITTAPSLTGYAFSHWSDKDANIAIEDNDLIEDLTRAVAIYKDDETKTFTVKKGEETVVSGVKYGESVTVNGSENFTAWKLGDKVVSYEKDYTFNVYGNITLTEVKGETMTKSPVLVLDNVDGNYFLTYDAGNYELVEAGILFGSSGVSIASVDGYKAAAKKGTGQFTALPHESADENTIARGYMICKNGGTFKVIYAD